MRYTQILEEIDEVLLREIKRSEIEKNIGIGIGNGVSGIILYLVNRFDFSSNEVVRNIVQGKVDDLLSYSSLVKNNPSILNGISGVAWLSEYLTNKYDIYDYTFNSNTDEIIIESVTQNDLMYEYINGLVGVSVYAKRRSEYNKLNTLYKIAFDKIISKTVSHSSSACCWNTEVDSFLRKNKNDDSELEVDFGLAHGNLGVVATMLNYHGIDIYKMQAEKTIKHAFNWYQKHKINNSYYDYPDNLKSINGNRLAWCYGDLIISYTFLRAGIKINNEYIVAEALKTAKKTTERKIENSFIVDSPLCHGRAGVSLLYNLLYEISPLDIFLEAENFWLDDLLQAYENNGIESLIFKSDSSIQRLGFLEGLSGVGLGLLALKESKKDWLDLILLK